MSRPVDPSPATCGERLRSRRGVVLGLGVAAMGFALTGASKAGVVAAPATSADPLTAELKRAAERGSLCSTSNARGTGLRGEYFAHDLGQGAPLLTRVDSTVNFDRSLEWPVAKAGARPAAVRWTGWIKPPIAGRYRFHADQPGARVVVARQPMVGEGAPADASIELAAGRFYPVTLELPHVDAISGRLKLEWTAPYGARYVVPQALLFVPNETAGPAGRS